MEFERDDLIQVLDYGKWTFLRVVDTEKFNKNNKAMVLVWDSYAKVNKKVAIHAIWEGSAIETVWKATDGKGVCLLPTVRYLGQWYDSGRQSIAIFDTWRRYDD